MSEDLDDEETRLQIAHYRAEFLRMVTYATNAASSRSKDLADWRADMEAMVERAQKFLTV